jgi:hypothetical protein
MVDTIRLYPPAAERSDRTLTVKLPKRLDLARDADRALDGVPGLIVANWVDGRT